MYAYVRNVHVHIAWSKATSCPILSACEQHHDTDLGTSCATNSSLSPNPDPNRSHHLHHHQRCLTIAPVDHSLLLTFPSQPLKPPQQLIYSFFHSIQDSPSYTYMHTVCHFTHFRFCLHKIVRTQGRCSTMIFFINSLN